MDKIKVEGISLYAYHGCLDEEAAIGTNYRVNVTVWGDLLQAAQADDLDNTLDYVIINRIVEEEVAIRAKLIENVADRILNRLLVEMPSLKKAKVKLSKMSPPINGEVDKVSVVMKRAR
jgi:dihydroneopterin aldolase